MDNPINTVVVTDFDMKFGSMVLFILKWFAATFIAGVCLALPLFFLYAMFIAVGLRLHTGF